MATKIVTKSGSGAPATTDLVAGELAVDLTNKRLYTENGSAAIIEVGSNPYNFTANHDGSAKLATTATGIDVTGSVTTTGSVGIGTSPIYDLDILDTSETILGIRASDSSGTNVAIRFQDAGTGTGVNGLYVGRASALNYFWTYEAEPILFGTSATERLRIDASGNLLVGLTSTAGIATGATADNGVYIDGSVGAVVAQSSANKNLYLSKATGFSDFDFISFQVAGASVGSIGTEGGDLTIGTGDVGLKFNNGSSLISPWDMTANAPEDGLFDLGYENGRFKDLYLSGGVYLGGTAAANKLDYYESGTWAPTVATGTISTLNSWYTKVGDVVTVGGLIYNFSDRTSAAQVIINNLPFTSSATVSAGSVFFRHVNTTADQVTMYTPANSTDIQFWGSSFAGNYIAISHSQLNSADARIFFSVTYQAT